MLGEQHNIILHETVTFWLVIIIEQIKTTKNHTPYTIPKAYLSANVRSCCSICKGHGWLLRVELEHLEVDSPSINIYQPFNGGMKIIAGQNNENKHVVHWHKRHNIPRSIFLKPLNSCSYSFQWINLRPTSSYHTLQLKVLFQCSVGTCNKGKSNVGNLRVAREFQQILAGMLVVVCCGNPGVGEFSYTKLR